MKSLILKVTIIILLFYTNNSFSQIGDIYKLDKLLFVSYNCDLIISRIEKDFSNYTLHFTFKSNSKSITYIDYQRISYDENKLTKINEIKGNKQKEIKPYEIFEFTINIPKEANFVNFTSFSLKSNEFTSNYNYNITIKLTNNLLPEYILIQKTTIYDLSKELLLISNKNKSDVDINIPKNSNKKQNRFALIFGNEDYKTYQKGLSAEANVDFAKNDANIFKEYCEKTLGIPSDNIILKLDADAKTMKAEIEKMQKILKYNGSASELIFYYSGHGLPDEATKSPYLIPVDVAGTELNEALKLNDICRKFSEASCLKVTFFIDACFSGKARNAPLLSKRSISIAPNKLNIRGNTIIFSASSNTLAAYPLKSQQHGLFTYYLLKKLQETSGNITYSEMFDYLFRKVGTESLKVLNAEQEPCINKSPDIENTWQNWKF